MAGNVSVLGSVSFGWLHDAGGFAFDEPFFMDPARRLTQEQAIDAFVAERFPDEPIYNFEAGLVQVEGRRHPVALVGAIQPNLILGLAVGAKLVYYRDRDPDITPAPLAGLDDVAPLWDIDWPATWPINAFLEQINAARRAFGRTHAVIPPFFWDTTGRATIHGLVTTAQKLIGQRLYIEMMDNASFVRDLFAWISESYLRLVRLFAEAAGLTVTRLHVGECSACMVGPAQLAEFVAPELKRLADALGPIRLHSCGRSDHLLEAFADLDAIDCWNVGSRTSVAKIRQRRGDVRIDLLPDAELLTAGGPADVDAWVRQAIAENGDGRLEFHYHLDRGQPEANALQINQTVRELGFVCRRER